MRSHVLSCVSFQCGFHLHHSLSFVHSYCFCVRYLTNLLHRQLLYFCPSFVLQSTFSVVPLLTPLFVVLRAILFWSPCAHTSSCLHTHTSNDRAVNTSDNDGFLRLQLIFCLK